MTAKISVIVPFSEPPAYQEECLADCLASVAAQTVRDLEIILVRDESDRVESAGFDGRLRQVLTADRGAQAARAAGVAAADGRYLAFVSADLVMPPYSLEYLLETLERTGSDFACGAARSFDRNGLRGAVKRHDVPQPPVLRTHVRDRESLFRDRVLTSKLWRRSFWEENGQTLEGDSGDSGDSDREAPPALRAHVLAKAVDVLSGVVSLRYVRPPDEAPSGPDRPLHEVLDDTVHQVQAVSRFLEEAGRPDLRASWDRTALTSDLRRLLEALPKLEAGHLRLLLAPLQDYLGGVAPQVLDRLPVIDRLQWHLAARNLLPELQTALDHGAAPNGKGRSRVVRRGRHHYQAACPFFEDAATGVPTSVYRLHDELKIRQKVESVRWDGDRLVVEGRAMVRGLKPKKRHQQWFRAWLVCAGTGRRTRLPVTSVQRGGDRPDWSGYHLEIDVARLKDHSPGTSWTVELLVFDRGVLRTTELAYPAAELGAPPAGRRLTEKTWLWPTWSSAGRLTLQLEKDLAVVTGHRIIDGFLELSGQLNPADQARDNPRLQLRRRPGGFPLEVPLTLAGTGAFHVRVPLSEVAVSHVSAAPHALDDGATWEVWLDAGDGCQVPVQLRAPESGYPVGAGRALVVRSGELDRLELRSRPDAMVVSAAEWTGDGSLLLTGQLPDVSSGTSRLVLRNQLGGREHAFRMRGGKAELTPAAVTSLAGTLPLPWGTYDLLVSFDDGDSDLAVLADRAQLDQVLGEQVVDGRPFELLEGPYERLRLKVGGDLSEEERGKEAQRALREEVYPRLRAAPVREVVLFESYFGRQFSDSPRAILEALRRKGAPYEFHWAVQDGQVALPDDVIPVRRLSRDYVEALATAKYIVTSTHLPMWFERRPGQTVLQTWHGSPLKRIGFDIDLDRVRFAREDYHRELSRAVAQWDHLVSQAPWCTPILREAFRYEGEILEMGYPRNDVFHAPGRERLADWVRERIGVPAGKKVLLYAPTWRDDKFHSRGRWRLDLRLDLERMRAELDEDHVLLVRCHPNITDPVPGAGKGFVFDVSAYPEMQELLLITDVLITDYSSVMFDFANTGRPMLFFTYDLETYRDELRGFYYDFEQEPPGPLLRSSDEVIAAVQDIGAVAQRYRGAYAAFAERTCPLDDGKAALRIAEHVFGC